LTLQLTRTGGGGVESQTHAKQ